MLAAHKKRLLAGSGAGRMPAAGREDNELIR